MTTQLTLLITPATPWQLDPSTRAIGRQGLAEARQALARVRTPIDPFASAARISANVAAAGQPAAHAA